MKDKISRDCELATVKKEQTRWVFRLRFAPCLQEGNRKCKGLVGEAVWPVTEAGYTAERGKEEGQKARQGGDLLDEWNGPFHWGQPGALLQQCGCVTVYVVGV